MSVEKIYREFTEIMERLSNLEAEVMGDQPESIEISQPLWHRIEMYLETMGHSGTRGMRAFQMRTAHGIIKVTPRRPPYRPKAEEVDYLVRAYGSDENWGEKKRKVKATEQKMKDALKKSTDTSFLDELRTI